MIICPECSTIKPARNDASVCSGSCRVKYWRKDISTYKYILHCDNVILDGTQTETKACSRAEADTQIAKVLERSTLEAGTYSFNFVGIK